MYTIKQVIGMERMCLASYNGEVPSLGSGEVQPKSEVSQLDANKQGDAERRAIERGRRLENEDNIMDAFKAIKSPEITDDENINKVFEGIEDPKGEIKSEIINKIKNNGNSTPQDLQEYINIEKETNSENLDMRYNDPNVSAIVENLVDNYFTGKESDIDNPTKMKIKQEFYKELMGDESFKGEFENLKKDMQNFNQILSALKNYNPKEKKEVSGKLGSILKGKWENFQKTITDASINEFKNKSEEDKLKELKQLASGNKEVGKQQIDSGKMLNILNNFGEYGTSMLKEILKIPFIGPLIGSFFGLKGELKDMEAQLDENLANFKSYKSLVSMGKQSVKPGNSITGNMVALGNNLQKSLGNAEVGEGEDPFKGVDLTNVKYDDIKDEIKLLRERNNGKDLTKDDWKNLFKDKNFELNIKSDKQVDGKEMKKILRGGFKAEGRKLKDEQQKIIDGNVDASTKFDKKPKSIQQNTSETMVA